MNAITPTKTTALAAFTAAIDDPANVDWQAIAAALAGALNTKRATKATAVDDGFAPWSEKDTGKTVGRFEILRVTFTDGITVETSVSFIAGDKARNIARNVRVACAFYRTRIRRKVGAGWIGGDYWGNPYSATLRNWDEHVTVPAIVSIEALDCGARWNPETANASTAELRAGTWSFADVQAEASDAGMCEEEIAAWLKDTFLEEGRADLIRRSMIRTEPTERLKRHRDILDRVANPVQDNDAPDEAVTQEVTEIPTNVVPFRRRLPAPHVAAWALSSTSYIRPIFPPAA